MTIVALTDWPFLMHWHSVSNSRCRTLFWTSVHDSIYFKHSCDCVRLPLELTSICSSNHFESSCSRDHFESVLSSCSRDCVILFAAAPALWILLPHTSAWNADIYPNPWQPRSWILLWAGVNTPVCFMTIQRLQNRLNVLVWIASPATPTSLRFRAVQSLSLINHIQSSNIENSRLIERNSVDRC